MTYDKVNKMKTIINENQRGLLFKNGKFEKYLNPGKYYSFLNSDIEILSLDEMIMSDYASLDVLMNSELKNVCDILIVSDNSIALRFLNHQFKEVLESGEYAYFTVNRMNDFIICDMNNPYVDESIPKYVFDKMNKKYFIKIEVNKYQKGLLYIDNQFVEMLESGTYYFWNGEKKVEAILVDTRTIQMEMNGQEILTADKVTLRVNFICQYKIMDYLKIFSEVDNYKEQLYVIAQLVLREYISKYKLDELLENKEIISQEINDKLKEQALQYYIDIVHTGIKDIILPGEVRDIMNTVLIAQKKAQANVITRREEVASTRSLLNTAKLMDENQTLYKLKELEYIERICQNVGEISLNANSDLISQLGRILKGES